MTETQINQGTSLDTENWLPLKEAATMAHCCVATIKRAIKARNLVGRKVGTAHNASYEIREDSLIAWAKIDSSPADDAIVTSAPGTNTPAAPASQQSQAAGAIDPTPQKVATTVDNPKTDRRQKPAAVKLPKEARLLRRWKNYMRNASQQQALAMIQWLSRRLKNRHGMRRNDAKKAIRNTKSA